MPPERPKMSKIPWKNARGAAAAAAAAAAATGLNGCLHIVKFFREPRFRR